MAGQDFLSQVLPAAQSFAGPPDAGGLALPPGVGAPQGPPPGAPPPPDYSPAMGPIASASLPADTSPGPMSPEPPPAPPPGPPQAAPPPAPATAPAAPAQTSAVTTAPPNEPMAGGVRVIPGHKVAAAELPQVGPSQERDWNLGEYRAEEAQRELASGKVKAAKLDAARAQVDFDNASDQAAAALQRQRDQQAVLDARRQQIDASTKELGSMHVDPNHFWASRGVGAQIAGAIAVALGGFAQGFSGGKVQNTAWEIIRSQMDDDLKAQVANIENKRVAVNQQQQQFQNLVQQYGMDSAKDIWAAAQRERVAAQVRQTAAMSAIPQIQSEAEAKVKEMQGEANKYRALAFKKYRPETSTGATVMVAGPTGQIIPIAVSPAKGFEQIAKNQEGAVNLTGQVALKAMDQQDKRAKEQKEQEGNFVRLPDGRILDAKKPEAAKEVRDSVAGTQEVQQLTERAARLRAELGLGSVVSGNMNKLTSPLERRAKVGELQSIQGQLAGALHKAYGARFNESEAKLSEKISGALLDTGPQTDAALQLMGQRANQQLGTLVKTFPEAPSGGGDANAAPIKEYK